MGCKKFSNHTVKVLMKFKTKSEFDFNRAMFAFDTSKISIKRDYAISMIYGYLRKQPKRTWYFSHIVKVKKHILKNFLRMLLWIYSPSERKAKPISSRILALNIFLDNQ